jgi:hypothetical protein
MLAQEMRHLEHLGGDAAVATAEFSSPGFNMSRRCYPTPANSRPITSLAWRWRSILASRCSG